MKKLIIALLAGVSILSANSGDLFDFDGQAGGGLSGDTITYVYMKDQKELPSNKSEAKILTLIAQKKVCKDSQARSFIAQGMRVQYIYVGKTSIAISTIDQCN
jgi:hypothetical protein